MDWSKFKLGVGPMSPEVVNACLRYSKHHNFPIMIIASRNQVDHDSGYAFKTNQFIEFVKNNENYDSNLIKICRDHCGPNFADLDKKYNLNGIIERCKKTIKSDIENGFDLIHIDVSRTDQNLQAQTARTLVEYALSLNPKIKIEFGSEDNTGQNLNDTLTALENQIELVKQYKENIVFLVNQTGSLTKHTQIGMFNSELSKFVSNVIHSNGYLFKEHNADYLSVSQVMQRIDAGVDAVNIAPQLGYIHSQVLSKLSYNYSSEFNSFKQYVLEKEYWKKWMIDGLQDPDIKFLVSAHYFFNSEYAEIIKSIIASKQLPFNELLYQEISLSLDQYRIPFKWYTI